MCVCIYIHTLYIDHHIIEHRELCMAIYALLQSISSITPVSLEAVTIC